MHAWIDGMQVLESPSRIASLESSNSLGVESLHETLTLDDIYPFHQPVRTCTISGDRNLYTIITKSKDLPPAQFSESGGGSQDGNSLFGDTPRKTDGGKTSKSAKRLVRNVSSPVSKRARTDVEETASSSTLHVAWRKGGIEENAAKSYADMLFLPAPCDVTPPARRFSSISGRKIMYVMVGG